MKRKNETARNFSDVVELSPVPNVDDDDGIFVQEIFQGLRWNSQNFSRSFLRLGVFKVTDKQLTGQNLDRCFRTSGDCVHVWKLQCFVAKLSVPKLKARPDNFKVISY